IVRHQRSRPSVRNRGVGGSRGRKNAIDRKRIELREGAPARRDRARRDSELLSDLAANFGDSDFKHYLRAAANGQRVDYESVGTDTVGAGCIGSPLRAATRAASTGSAVGIDALDKGLRDVTRLLRLFGRI